MPGTKDGYKKGQKTLKKKYSAEEIRQWRVKGGKKGKTGGFYANRELAAKAGRKGGIKAKG
jgi:hypothetical protein